MNTVAKLILLPITASLALSFTCCGEREPGDHNNEEHDHSAAAEGSSTETSEYPLSTCVVSGEALGSMGTPVEVIHDGVTVKLCCESCIDDFNVTPEVFVDKVKAGN